jgi:L-threonylcarbamoyladenylate synthase
MPARRRRHRLSHRSRVGPGLRSVRRGRGVALARDQAAPVDKGVILVAAALAQFDGLLDWDRLPRDRADIVRASWPGPRTWIVPATARMPRWITGTHTASRCASAIIPIVVALCRAFGAPLVSTSANLAGEPPAFDARTLSPDVLARVDGVTGRRNRRPARAHRHPRRRHRRRTPRRLTRRQPVARIRPTCRRKMRACASPPPASSPSCSSHSQVSRPLAHVRASAADDVTIYRCIDAKGTSPCATRPARRAKSRKRAR